MNTQLRNLRFTITVAMLCVAGASSSADDDVSTQLDIAYESFALGNGLTVLVHSDHSTPTVFVGLWYGVGSKDEPEGKSGFAHLFEHLMFQGTENRDGEYFSPFADAGATGMNGTTSEDRTNYYATVPTGALDMALWMESDRMTYLLGAVKEEQLDEQRGVVQNEKRQRENQPYAQSYTKAREAIYPADHPYRHSVIGSMDDLDAAAIEDVHEWFKTYYGASNVVMVLSGDIDIVTAKDKVQRYFGEAPAGEPLFHRKEWLPALSHSRKEMMYDTVGQTRITRTWVLPGLNSKDASLFSIIGKTLAGDKSSPLQKQLVDELQLVTRVSAQSIVRLMSGEFHLTVDVRPGVDPDQVMAEVERILAEFLFAGPDSRILENAKLGTNISLLGSVESAASIGSMLAEGQLFSDDPLFINKELEWLNATTTGELQEIANRWLSQSYYELTVLPFPEYQIAEAAVDRSSIPKVVTDSSIEFPDIETLSLKNGMKLVVANRGASPLIDVRIRVGTGAMADPAAARGVSEFVFGLLDKGTKNYSAEELSAAKDKIAMQGGAQSGAESSTFGFRILRKYLDESLQLSNETLRNPIFPEVEIQKMATQIGAWLANQERSPGSAAGGLFDRAIFGEDSAMGAVWTPELLQKIDRQLLLNFHRKEIAPDNMTVFMIGDISLDEAAEAVGRAFGKWRATAESNLRPIGDAKGGERRVILIDHPGVESSTIIAGHELGAHEPDNATAMTVLNAIIGGSFESRLNLNLREDKSWTYGYRSGISRNISGDQVFVTSGQVQTDKTMESMTEIKREIAEFASNRPATDSEVDRIKINSTRSLPASFATNRGFLSSMMSSSAFGMPYDYDESEAERIASVSAASVAELARKKLDVERLSWVIVGDLEQIEDKVRSLNFGEVEVWDAYGKRLR